MIPIGFLLIFDFTTLYFDFRCFFFVLLVFIKFNYTETNIVCQFLLFCECNFYLLIVKIFLSFIKNIK